MGQTQDRGQHLKREIAESGHRMTKLRSHLLDIFANQHGPFSCEELGGLLRADNVRVHKVTLYREIDVLLRLGVITQIRLHDPVSRYELAERVHHHHVVCTECGRVEEIEGRENLGEMESWIARSKNFFHISHSLEFFGICATCHAS